MLAMAMMLAAAKGDDLHAWARFARAPVLAHTSETVEVASQGFEQSTRLHFVMRLTRRRLGKVVEVAWADGATCPAVRETVAAMRTLPMPVIAPPGAGIDGDIVLDGTGYSFSGPTRDADGQVEFSTNTGSPLAAWVDAQLDALSPCWKPTKS